MLFMFSDAFMHIVHTESWECKLYARRIAHTSPPSSTAAAAATTSSSSSSTGNTATTIRTSTSIATLNPAYQTAPQKHHRLVTGGGRCSQTCIGSPSKSPSSVDQGLL